MCICGDAGTALVTTAVVYSTYGTIENNDGNVKLRMGKVDEDRPYVGVDAWRIYGKHIYYLRSIYEAIIGRFFVRCFSLTHQMQTLLCTRYYEAK